MVKTTLLVLLALVVGAIVGVGFLAALAKFGFDVAKKVFNIAFQTSSCLIRSSLSSSMVFASWGWQPTAA